jgi:hypothetical protein
VSTEPVGLARIDLRRLELAGKGAERDRRPTQDELDRIISALEANIRQQIPFGRIIRFAVATAMRQDEIARAEWCDFDASGRMRLVRNRKDPRKKKGNDQRIPLLDVSGYDACKIIEEQGRFSNIREGRICPYDGRSVGTVFRRQCRELKIDDLHFHDLRHEGTSRFFEAGFSIEQVALVTGIRIGKCCAVTLTLSRKHSTQTAVALPVVCRSGAGRRQAGGSRSDVVMSGVVDSGRDNGHGNIDANDPKRSSLNGPPTNTDHGCASRASAVRTTETDWTVAPPSEFGLRTISGASVRIEKGSYQILWK